MMTTPDTLDHEQLAADAQRLADLHGGAAALLIGGECNPTAVAAARMVLLESKAILSTLVDDLVSHAERVASGHRAERLHREEQARVTASNVAVSR